MTSSAIVVAQFGFNQAMNERLWAIIMAHLTDAQFVQEAGYSRGSIRSQVMHMANAQRYWFHGLLDAPETGDLMAEDYPTREAARVICQQVDQASLDRVCGLTDADLERIPDGWSQPVWVAMLQMAHHGTDHRAQILRRLHDLGAPTFEQNFALYMEYATPMSVQGLSEQIGQKRAEWEAVLRQVPAEQMDQPMMESWTVRDVIAILTWKERRVMAMIRDRAVVEASFGELATAEQASILAASRALPLPALLEQHQAANREMLDAIRTLADADLNSSDIRGLPPDERFWKAIAGATWWSYPGLTAPIRQLLNRI
jgi:uncharacterized damage-inducible protein DinB